MDVKTKIGIITNHLILEKTKAEAELERFVNSDVPIDEICSKIGGKLNNYRDSISNFTLWLEFIEPIDNKPEEGNN